MKKSRCSVLFVVGLLAMVGLLGCNQETSIEKTKAAAASGNAATQARLHLVFPGSVRSGIAGCRSAGQRALRWLPGERACNPVCARLASPGEFGNPSGSSVP